MLRPFLDRLGKGNCIADNQCTGNLECGIREKGDPPPHMLVFGSFDDKVGKTGFCYDKYPLKPMSVQLGCENDRKCGFDECIRFCKSPAPEAFSQLGWGECKYAQFDAAGFCTLFGAVAPNKKSGYPCELSAAEPGKATTLSMGLRPGDEITFTAKAGSDDTTLNWEGCPLQCTGKTNPLPVEVKYPQAKMYFTKGQTQNGSTEGLDTPAKRAKAVLGKHFVVRNVKNGFFSKTDTSIETWAPVQAARPTTLENDGRWAVSQLWDKDAAAGEADRRQQAQDLLAKRVDVAEKLRLLRVSYNSYNNVMDGTGGAKLRGFYADVGMTGCGQYYHSYMIVRDKVFAGMEDANQAMEKFFSACRIFDFGIGFVAWGLDIALKASLEPTFIAMAPVCIAMADGPVNLKRLLGPTVLRKIADAIPSAIEKATGTPLDSKTLAAFTFSEDVVKAIGVAVLDFVCEDPAGGLWALIEPIVMCNIELDGKQCGKDLGYQCSTTFEPTHSPTFAPLYN